MTTVRPDTGRPGPPSAGTLDPGDGLVLIERQAEVLELLVAGSPLQCGP